MGDRIFDMTRELVRELLAVPSDATIVDAGYDEERQTFYVTVDSVEYEPRAEAERRPRTPVELVPVEDED